MYKIGLLVSVLLGVGLVFGSVVQGVWMALFPSVMGSTILAGMCYYNVMLERKGRVEEVGKHPAQFTFLMLGLLFVMAALYLL